MKDRDCKCRVVPPLPQGPTGPTEPESAFRAENNTQNQTYNIPTVTDLVNFPDEIFDLNNEYSPS
ncbi:hypothetical protein [Bacillus sp. SM2101]|uniref:hypothetical protein n=1 Tax=Bacillus sp. SM2101 TaxID=2805366 RepID=UPI001BDEDB40|nr:hypothetical protein [Bacillus sp. SM2101]